MHALNTQLKFDNHDIALDEKLEIITTCFEKNVGSVIMQMPETEEMQLFRTCVRKFSRTKMRAVSYYHQHLHKPEAEQSTYLLKNLWLMKSFLPQYQPE
jgi:hypothetical protein